ncbi:hypothetical protein HOH87_05335 [bacterium]|jgi:hypothetical protein|nr:hypothetical protein [bacterium]
MSKREKAHQLADARRIAELTKNKRTKSLRLNPDLIELVEDIAEELGETFPNVVENKLIEYIIENEALHRERK